MKNVFVIGMILGICLFAALVGNRVTRHEKPASVRLDQRVRVEEQPKSAVLPETIVIEEPPKKIGEMKPGDTGCTLLVLVDKKTRTTWLYSHLQIRPCDGLLREGASRSAARVERTQTGYVVYASVGYAFEWGDTENHAGSPLLPVEKVIVEDSAK